MKTITITSSNRLNYLKPMLESLSKNDTSDWEIFISIEPSEVREKTIDMAEDILPYINFVLPERQMGVSGNPHSILEHVFEKRGSTQNIYLEDDLLLSPDVCNLADWYFSNESQDKDNACLCLCNINPSEFPVERCQSSALMSLDNGVGFNALGLFLSKDSWLSNFKPHWGGSWDHGVKAHIVRSRKRVVLPYVSRSDHIGDWGAHIHGPAHNNGLGFGNLPLCQQIPDPKSYHIALSRRRA